MFAGFVLTKVFKLSNIEFGSSTTVLNSVTSDQAGSTSTMNLLSTANTAFNIAKAGTKRTSGTTGKDVAGTLNGEAATGRGSVLTGDAGNANTNNLKVLHSRTAAGASSSPGSPRCPRPTSPSRGS